jgi:hypothetical protein
MKIIRRSLLLALLIFSFISYSQVENVPLNHPVYIFLKQMKVKNIIPYISEDVPNLSRFEVKGYLQEVESKYDQLSSTERNLLNRYKVDFYEVLDTANTNYFFNPNEDFGESLAGLFSNKIKYFYAYSEESANIFIEVLGDYYYGQQFKPEVNNSHLFDIGFRMRGTVFDHLGYNLTVLKGGAAGSRSVAELIYPKLLQSYKWVENGENIGNYDFTEGYIKYYTEPAKDMGLTFQLGREFKTIGYGYGNKLVLSGLGPSLDFIQFDFDYGIVHFTSIHGTTVGNMSFNYDDRYTKFWTFNRLKLSFQNLFEIGIGESVVYSDRGIDISYLTPVGFYKFIEHSTQDRDNANLYFDLQTNFIDNLELQGTFLLDENILSNLQDLDSYKNKTAYQLGLFWYEAFTLNDLSFIFEYTKIRPYVYTHYNPKITYTGWGFNLGHPIGPNSDELLSKLSYDVNDWMRVSLNYRYIRSGENVYDTSGTLIKNVGGDIEISHGPQPQNETAIFLDGIRINNNIFEAGIRVEPIRDFIFSFLYQYNYEKNLTLNLTNHQSYCVLKFQIGY